MTHRNYLCAVHTGDHLQGNCDMQLVDGRPCPNCIGTGQVLKRRELNPYNSARMKCPLCINGYESEYYVFRWLAALKKEKVKPAAKSTPLLTDADRAGLAELFEDFNKPKSKPEPRRESKPEPEPRPEPRREPELKPEPQPPKPVVNVPHHFILSTKNGRLCNVCLGLKRDKVHIVEEAPEPPPIVIMRTNPPDREWSRSHHFQGMSAREMDYERQRILKKHGKFNGLAMFIAMYAFCQIMLGLLILVPQANHDLAVIFYGFFHARNPYTAASFYQWWQEWSMLIGIGFTISAAIILLFLGRRFIMRGKHQNRYSR